ncbi:MAG: hypothetical protein ABSE40_21190 [Candidatus Sulfotelmatobacter sp.]
MLYHFKIIQTGSLLARSARKSTTLERNTRNVISACTPWLQLVPLFEAYLITVPATSPCAIDLRATRIQALAAATVEQLQHPGS